MATTTLKKWGNSQGFIIPKSVCEYANISLDDEMEIHVVRSTGSIVLTPAHSRYHRSRKLSAAELLAGWQGGYTCPPDLQGDGSVGEESDWGGPAGKEAW